MSELSNRAQAAREKIMNSGNPDLINRLHLMEVTGKDPTRMPPSSGSGLFGLGLAAFGGAYLGNLLAGTDTSDEMAAAFAAIAEELGLEAGEADDTAGGATGASDEDDGGFGLF